MGAFMVVPQDTFKNMQLDAGVLLNRFDPTNPNIQDEDIITATTGGVTITCKPTFTDLFSDVDNVRNNTKEGQYITDWDCSLATSALNTSEKMIRMSIGAADVLSATYAITTDTALVTGKTYYTRSGTSPNYTYTKVTTPAVADIATYYEQTSAEYKIVPRGLKQSDFASSVWWVGEKAGGGFVAAELKNALSTEGISLKTTKNSKGPLSITIKGFFSISAPDVVPMVFYSTPNPTAES